VDPGLQATGYAVLAGEAVLDHGCLRYDRRCGSAAQRRELYREGFRALLQRWAAGESHVHVVFETQFVNVRERGARGQARANAALGLAVLRGALESVAREGGAEVHHAPPQAGKRALAGVSDAGKDTMIRMARARLGLNLLRKDEHVADAAGLALAGQNAARARQAVQEAL